MSKIALNISKSSQTPEYDDTDIAIIGMAGRFPGADNLVSFWENILHKKEGITHFSNNELKDNGITSTKINNSNYVKARGILTDIDKFDAPFFNTSPYDATIMDPQHRIFMEQCWGAIENAGYSIDSYKGLIGLFAGMSDSHYLHNNLFQNKDFLKKHDEYQTMLATSSQFLCTKVAYSLNLKGPCININTACSTSLVAVIMACKSLIDFECDMALAGGISIYLPQLSGYEFHEGGILSPDGHCRAFDKNARGTVSSNGVGLVVLKRFDEAIKDHDNIIAIIKGWATNNDGADKVGFTAPSVTGQANCVAQAVAFADIDPTAIGYIEAHGTGTAIGDPIEIAALAKGYQHNYQATKPYCAIGSVKTNIGHTDVAAGIAGLIKTAFALKEKILPSSLHFKEPNSRIDFSKTPFYVNTTTKAWKNDNGPRYAAVNSLGIGGTNAHIILKEAPESILNTDTALANAILLSAKTNAALENATANLRDFLNGQEIKRTNLTEIAYTLQVGRNHFRHRRAFSCTSTEECIQTLSDTSALNKLTSVVTNDSNQRIIFGFPGQGSQYVNMACDLYDEQPYFKDIVDSCCHQLIKNESIDIKSKLFPDNKNLEHASRDLAETQNTQLILFIVEYALAKLLIHLNVKPTAMIGHSIGEYVAACISGVISLEDALRMITLRGSLMAKTQPGLMIAIPQGAPEIKPLLTKDLSIAAANSPSFCVVSGPTKSIDVFLKKLTPFLANKNLGYRKLNTSRAFHSSTMDEILAHYSEATENVTLSSPKIPYVSNIIGSWINLTELKHDYWSRHIRNTVLFSTSIAKLDLIEDDIFIEVGPGTTIATFIRQCQHDKQAPTILTTLPHAKDALIKPTNNYKHFLSCLSKLWLKNQSVDWLQVHKHTARKRIPLPTYTFDDHRYWIYPSDKQKNSRDNLIKNAANLVYIPTWGRDPVASTLKKCRQAGSREAWLLFMDNCGLANGIHKKLTGAGKIVYCISAADHFEKTGVRKYTICPSNKDDYTRLFEHLENTGEKFYILHFFQLSEKNAVPLKLHQNLQLGVYSLLYICQVFADILAQKTLNALVVTNKIHQVTGHDTIDPLNATTLGPCKVIPLEQENIAFKLIDVDYENSQTDNKNLIDSILSEAVTLQPHEHQTDIAYREGLRWVKKYRPYPEIMTNPQANLIKQNGIYVITGGLGGLGLTLANYLTEHYKVHVALIARPNKTKNISSLANKFTIEYAHVENKPEMKVAINNIKQRFGRINGIIHAAGLPGGGIAQLKTPETYEKILRPKVQGTEVILSLAENESVDFIALFSSITAVTGAPGQVDYCSANAFLDAIATIPLAPNKVPLISINWQAWREVGMAANSKTMLVRLNESNSLSPDQGCLLFEKIINSRLNSVAVSSKQNIKSVLDQQSTQTPAIERKSSPEPDKQSLECQLAKIWHDLLGIDDIDFDDDFYELGGHSLMAVSMITRIKKELLIKVKLSTLIENRTISSLAKTIRSSLQNLAESPIVTLQKGQGLLPLFLFHPIGGTSFCYIPLIQYLNNDRPIYGFQDPSINSELALFNSLEEMAGVYLSEILKVQPTGPYYLCGSSFGASLAVEVAYQLIQKGKDVRFVGLIDGWAKFSSMQYDKNHSEKLLKRYQQNSDSRILPTETNNPGLWLMLLKYRMKLLLAYQPKTIGCKLTLYKAKTLLPEYKEIASEYNHWEKYTNKGVVVHTIPGNHNTMLQGPNLRSLAEAIERSLEVNKTTITLKADKREIEA